MSGDNFGPRSRKHLGTCHPLLRKLLTRVGETFPTTILEGMRSREQQERNVAKGVSKTMNSLHLTNPSEAVDAAPDGFSWPQAGKLQRRIASVVGSLKPEQSAEIQALIDAYVKEVGLWYYWSGHVSGIAAEMNIPIRQGSDWNGNRQIDDQSFDDLPHIELRLPA
jgi:peptidoglycan L-alanyl-D-glutamate endopeptidase CwlK